jgi:phenylalanyl-tRNA synthetase beta chain
MKFSLSWLKTHLETAASLTEIADTLSAIGLEVENIEDCAAALAPFRIAYVIEAVQHPNADRLRVCTVDTGGETVSVVCGAPNVRTGMKAVFAPPGSFIPGTGITLKVGEIRGVKSAGMLLSIREMGLGEDHDGIADLPPDAPIGQPYAAWAGLDDPIIDIAVTTNRGDALSIRGVARDLAADGLGTLKPWSAPAITGQGASTIIWRDDFLKACPWILGRTVRGVTNGESPDWLQQRLISIGLRPINTLADITNFFTHDLGRPLHVFDADKIAGGFLTLRRGDGETFAGLHGRDVTVTPDDCVIADAKGAQSLAGIVGGEATSCDETTTNVFIECALFDRAHIARTGQRTKIHSDARQRFERGIDQAFLPAALDAATAMIMEICGGTPSEITEAGAEPSWQRQATLRFTRLHDFASADIAPDRAIAILENLGFGIAIRTPDAVTVSVPSWRNDIAATDSALDPDESLPAERLQAAAQGAAAIEPEVDLIEEVLRIDGLDKIPALSLPGLPPVPRPILTAKQSRTALARRILAARGLTEAVTFSFLDHATAARFGDAPASLTLANPIAADLDQMRPTPLATLAQAASRNAARGYPNLGLFEIGGGFTDERRQSLIAAGLRAGSTPLSWLAAARPVSVFDAKADALAALAALGVPMEALTITADTSGYYHPGQSGALRQGPKTILAQFGILHPALCAALDLPQPIAAFEIFLDAIAEPKRRRKAGLTLFAFQPLRRDFAFLLDATTPADTLIRAAKSADRGLITAVTLFDRYGGDKLPAGKISLAIAVTLQPQESSLTDAEIEAVSAKIIAAVVKATGAELRG